MNRIDRPAPQARSIAPATNPSGSFDRTRHERFQRQLLPFPFECELGIDENGAGPEPAGMLAEWARERAGDGPPGDQRDEQEPAPHDDCEPVHPPAAPVVPADAAPWQPAAIACDPRAHGGRDNVNGNVKGDRDGKGDAGKHGAAPVDALPGAGDAPAWLHNMVDQVANLCVQGDARFQHWSLTLPLDPTVLSDSELRLSLSPGAMTLRFRTASEQAASLVCRYRDELHARLAALPSSPAVIDIDLE